MLSLIIDCLSVILCCIGVFANLREGIGNKPDMLVIIILSFLLFVSAYNLVRSVKKLKVRDK